MAEMGEMDQALPEVQACQKHLSGSSSYYSPCFGQVRHVTNLGIVKLFQRLVLPLTKLFNRFRVF